MDNPHLHSNKKLVNYLVSNIIESEYEILVYNSSLGTLVICKGELRGLK